MKRPTEVEVIADCQTKDGHKLRAGTTAIISHNDFIALARAGKVKALTASPATGKPHTREHDVDL